MYRQIEKLKWDEDGDRGPETKGLDIHERQKIFKKRKRPFLLCEVSSCDCVSSCVNLTIKLSRGIADTSADK